jgi:hypothetical protein
MQMKGKPSHYKKKKQVIPKFNLPDFAIKSSKNPIDAVITTPKDYLLKP